MVIKVTDLSHKNTTSSVTTACAVESISQLSLRKEGVVKKKNGNGISRRKLLASAGAAGLAAVVPGVVSGAAQEKKGDFDPNRLKIDACAKRVKDALQKVGFDIEKQIVTSRDREAVQLRKELATRNIPGGFSKWQLPIDFARCFAFISVASAEVKVPEHSHDEGSGIRFIASGSIIFKGKELTAGDWMYIPKGAKYSFEVGPFGATLFYCYQC
jgi:hypothetical protein